MPPVVVATPLGLAMPSLRSRLPHTIAMERAFARDDAGRLHGPFFSGSSRSATLPADTRDLRVAALRAKRQNQTNAGLAERWLQSAAAFGASAALEQRYAN